MIVTDVHLSPSFTVLLILLYSLCTILQDVCILIHSNNVTVLFGNFQSAIWAFYVITVIN